VLYHVYGAALQTFIYYRPIQSFCIYPRFLQVGREWSASRPGRFNPGERAPGTHWIGGWVGPRASLDDMEKEKFLPPLGLELQTLGHPARS
jgi:hypothetical protein